MSKGSHQKERYFNIHGDNIVECERTIDLILSAFSLSRLTLDGPFGFPTNPSFMLYISEIDQKLNFTFYPGLGRWQQNVLDYVKAKNGAIREAPDVILTEIFDNMEKPIMAIEYSSALAAGNQAWQRNGRAYSFGKASIPFLYISEIGGHELSKNRSQKSVRYPNPAVPFSYLSFTIYIGNAVLPVYLPNDGIDAVTKNQFESIFGQPELLTIIRKLLLREDINDVTSSIEIKAIKFIKLLSSNGRQKNTLTPKQWEEGFNFIKTGQNKDLPSFLENIPPIKWQKKAYIANLTPTLRNLKNVASELGIGITSSNLPICLIPRNNRSAFAKAVSSIYNNLDSEFVSWLNQDCDLVICWVMGFKPRGDDARPDRGLPPMTRMLIGSSTELLTVIYGPAPEIHWSLLMENPVKLAEQNGLWEAIMVVSDAILVDSSTDKITNHGFLKSHFSGRAQKLDQLNLLVPQIPNKLGENDVDTVIHLIFAIMGKENVFEGFINPPGGDWSGVYLLSPDRNTLFKWLSLPRVSGVDTKRPDHIYQLFEIGAKPIILLIESKVYSSTLEDNIGPRLTRYLKNLITYSPDIQRKFRKQSSWTEASNKVDADNFEFVTGAGFLIQEDDKFSQIVTRTNVDILIGLEFSKDKKACTVHLFAKSDTGNKICKYILSLKSKIDISFRILSN